MYIFLLETVKTRLDNGSNEGMLKKIKDNSWIYSMTQWTNVAIFRDDDKWEDCWIWKELRALFCMLTSLRYLLRGEVSAGDMYLGLISI